MSSEWSPEAGSDEPESVLASLSFEQLRLLVRELELSPFDSQRIFDDEFTRRRTAAADALGALAMSEPASKEADAHLHEFSVALDSLDLDHVVIFREYQIGALLTRECASRGVKLKTVAAELEMDPTYLSKVMNSKAPYREARARILAYIDEGRLDELPRELPVQNAEPDTSDDVQP
jgi:AraC-like DNA-binding protein